MPTVAECHMTPGAAQIQPLACLCVGRVGVLPSGSLRIQAPSRQDEGLYTCTARNRLGSTSVSSWLQISGNHSVIDDYLPTRSPLVSARLFGSRYKPSQVRLSSSSVM